MTALPTTDKIMDDLLAALDSAFDGVLGKGRSITEWTNAVKISLVEAGNKLKLYTSARGVSDRARNGEWQYDVSWVDYDFGEHPSERKNWAFKTCVLAAEIEWARNIGDIADDFEKLLASRAQLKCMVTHVPANCTMSDVTRYIERALNVCTHDLQKETGLVAIYDNKAVSVAYYRIEGRSLTQIVS